MLKFLEGLLLLARADGRALAMRREALDLREVVADAVEAAQPQAAQRGLTLHSDLQSAPVAGDPDQLGQVVGNLLANALAYNRPGGGVVVTLRQVGPQAQLSVADTGVGIAAADLPHVFQRFYRGDPARSGANAGSGLGLATCREIVRAHDGRIDAASTEGKGSVLTVWLPLSGAPPMSHAPGVQITSAGADPQSE